MTERKKVRYQGFQTTSTIVLCIATLLVLFPFILLIISSFTDEKTLMVNGYTIFPQKWSLEAYRYIFLSTEAVLNSYGLSVIVTAIGTTISLTMTCLMAYPISRPDFRWKTLVSFLVFFTMLFNGGLVSQYMLWATIFQIKNTLLAYLLPNLLMNAFNVMLVRNFYSTNIPYELVESAKIDGAGEWYTFFKIVFPMSTPILAAIGLLIALLYWNDWINGLYYINNTKLYTYQNLLNRMIQQVNFLTSGEAGAYISGQNIQVPSVSLRMAIASIGVLPIIMIYPFFQKYFAKGLTLGAVKG